MPAMSADFLRQKMLSAVTETKGVVYRGPNSFESLAGASLVPAALPWFEAALAAGRFALQPLLAQLAEAGLCSVLDSPTRRRASSPTQTRPPFFVRPSCEAARLLRFQNRRACA